jgi:protein phosphatase
MGGHACGEIASAMAVETLQRYFSTYWREELPDQETIEKGIHLANQTIFRINQEKESHGSGRMGTTLVLALVQDTKVVVAHVGDSRVYRVNRKWGLEQLTVDHEVGQKAISEGVAPKIAYSRPDAYQLTQALGPHDDQYVKPGIKYLQLHEDTLLLLCSDGLSDNKLVENNWETHLKPLISASANMDEGLRSLINLGNQKNGHDNITAILVRIKVQPNIEQPLWL